MLRVTSNVTDAGNEARMQMYEALKLIKYRIIYLEIQKEVSDMIYDRKFIIAAQLLERNDDLSKFLKHKKKLIYNCIIAPHFDYCASILWNASNENVKKLQLLQNKGMRTILNCNCTLWPTTPGPSSYWAVE